MERIIIPVIVFCGGLAVGWLARDLAGVPAVPGEPAPKSTGTEHSREIEAVRSQLAAGRDDQAISLLEKVRSDLPRELSFAVASPVLLEATRRLEAGRLAAAESLLTKYLNALPGDPDGYHLLARIQGASGNQLAAARTYLMLLPYVGSDEALAIRDLLHQRTRELFHGELEETLQSQLLDLLYDAARSFPGYEPFWIQLATLQAELDLVDDAYASLRNISFYGANARHAEKIEYFLDRRVDRGASYDSRLDLERLGSHYLAELEIVTEQQETLVKLIVDTGAAITLLRPDVAKDMGIDPDALGNRRRFATPGGVVEAPVTWLDTIVIADHVLWNIEIGIVELQAPEHVGGLLGMNILGQFEFDLDQGQAVLSLARK